MSRIEKKSVRTTTAATANTSRVAAPDVLELPLDPFMLQRNQLPLFADTHCRFHAAWQAHERAGRVGPPEARVVAHLSVVPALRFDMRLTTPVAYVASRKDLLDNLQDSENIFTRRELAAALKQLIAIGWVRPMSVGKGRFAYLVHGAEVYPTRDLMGTWGIEECGIDAMATRSLDWVILRPVID